MLVLLVAGLLLLLSAWLLSGALAVLYLVLLPPVQGLGRIELLLMAHLRVAGAETAHLV